MGATIRDVAKAAQVSPATVSRYFSGSSVVGKELSKRIEKAARTLGYIPDHKVKKGQGIIVVLVPHLQLGYFSEVLKEIIRQVPKYRYRVMILPTIVDDDSYKTFFKELYVVGVIYVDENIDKDMLHYIQAKNIKVVMLGGAAYDSRCDMVHINDMSAAYEGMKYLLELNHKEILILSDKPGSISSGFQRLVGCQQAMREYGIAFNKENSVELGDLTYENGYRATSQAINTGKCFTAIFAFSDEVALGAISALYDRGIMVPADISVLGFDGISISNRVVPRLTTIYQPIGEMVEWALNSFYSTGRGKQTRKMEYTLPYRLVEGGTCIRREEKR